MSVLPKSLLKEVAAQVERAREFWREDREAGLAGVYIAGALARKFRRAAESFEWFWLFPARQISLDPECGLHRRHHLHGQGEVTKRRLWRMKTGLPSLLTMAEGGQRWPRDEGMAERDDRTLWFSLLHSTINLCGRNVIVTQ